MKQPPIAFGKVHSKVIPLKGELYQDFEPQAPKPTLNPLIGLIGVIAGLALGAICVYQSPDQVQLRSLQTQSEQLTKIKTEVCN